MTDYIDLYRQALLASENAYAPYSGFKVGAAILCRDGSVFTGVNVENASYGATICAERVALATAISVGKRDFQAIAVASIGAVAYPCGICRQVIFEFGDDIKVIAGIDEKSIEIIEIKELLPKGFRLWNQDL